MKRSQISSRPVMSASGRSNTPLKMKNQWPRAISAFMRSKMMSVGMLSIVTKRSAASGKSFTKRVPTRAPRSWPTMAAFSQPRCSISARMSLAIVRLS